MKLNKKILLKHLFLLMTGGFIYSIIEILYRGYSHISVFMLGGVCFVCIGLINEELFEWDISLFRQSIVGGLVITYLECWTGCLVNLVLGLNVWDYSSLKFNLYGQISLSFFFVWCLLSIVAIVLDDYIRYYIFKEQKPKYKII